jgi:hypothetical protein
MKYKNYIVSFVGGSSGRFVRSLLDRIIKNSEEPIPLTDQNSAHSIIIPIAYDLSWDECDVNHKDVFNYLEFLGTDSIFPTHTYPDFKLLNSKFNDVGTILIQFDVKDCAEIMVNSWFKNEKIAHPSEILIPKIKRQFNQTVFFSRKKFSSFIYDPDFYEDNTVILRYHQIYEKTDNSYKVLDILKEFTGASNIPNSVIEACDRYSEGRNILLKQAGLR